MRLFSLSYLNRLDDLHMRPINRPTFICALVVISVLIGFSNPSMAGDDTMTASRSKILPTKAFLVFTKESWGCPGGMTIVSDVTEDLVAAEGKPVSLTEIKNPEDVDNRLELYLYFSARNIMGLPGYLALRLGVAGPEAQVPGTLRIEESALVADGKGVSFILKAKTNGQLKPELLYAGDTSLSSGLFNCPAAGLFEPHPVKFLGVYPIRTELHFTTSKIDLQWDKIIIRADEFQIRETQSVAACYGLLAGLEKEFSASKEYLFLWDQSQLTPDRVGQVASYFERSQNYKFNVSIELRSPKGKTQIQPDSTPFLPQLRQTIAVRNAQAKITGGIIMLAVEKEVSN